VPSEHDFTRREVAVLPAFWLIVVAASLTTLGTNGFHANWIPFFQDEGFSAAEASLAATAYGICSLTTRIFWGWGAERISLRQLMALQSVLTALSVLGFLLIDSRGVLVVAAAFNGLALGGVFIMRPMIVATYFGRGHLGAINGLLRPFMTGASAFSPLLVAWIFEARGSYDLVFWLLAGCWVLAAGAVVLARQPRRSPTVI
jgi:MFS family permease